MAEKICTNIGHGGGPVLVHVDDDKIIRVRPLVFADDEMVPSWTLEARGRRFTPLRKDTVAPYGLTEKARTYADDRTKYPMKRVDWDPKGAPGSTGPGGRNNQNRGKSGYERISWEEALAIVAGEIKRVRETYGPEAVAYMSSSHHNAGSMGTHRSTLNRFFKMIGATDYFDNPDSWEGWLWGAAHTWGFFWRMGPPEQFDLLEDVMKNTELIVFWASDPDTNRGAYSGQDSAEWRVWLKQLGIRCIFIDPHCNFTAGTMNDKWIAPRPGTDAALAEAIAYIWLTEGTYDKEYVANRTVGFEEFRDQVLGKTDGLERTPAWAAEKCDIPERVIWALAREWASKRTTLSCGMRGVFGGACREAYGHEWARLMVLLIAMQGLGKPGINMWGATMGAPSNFEFRFPGFENGGMQQVGDHIWTNKTTQRVYRTQFPDSIMNPPVSWKGEGFNSKSLEQQFIPYTYPEPGKSEIKLFYRHGGSFIGTMPQGTKWLQAYQSPKIETLINQDCWWCSETGYADLILPACTNFERDDIGEFGNCGWMSPDTFSGNIRRVIVYMKKCIEPLYESKPDYWIYSQLAARLGMEQEYTEGRSEEDWIRKYYDWSDLHKMVGWDEFKERGYYLVPIPERTSTPALRWFAEGRECDTPDLGNPKRGTDKAKELGTYTGLIEFKSKSLEVLSDDHTERPLVPRYIPSWEGHETTDLYARYPLQLISPHPRFSFHTMYDHTEMIWDIPAHRMLIGGYYYLTCRINPVDAAARGINEGDVIRLFNDRHAGVLCGAHVTHRVRPGTLHAFESSAKYDPIEAGNPASVDRAGCVNLLATDRQISKGIAGVAPNSTLVEIAKWEG
jgi:molybdopterin guanine dinucleotide-containing S/N-oxide reductase-like protein